MEERDYFDELWQVIHEQANLVQARKLLGMIKFIPKEHRKTLLQCMSLLDDLYNLHANEMFRISKEYDLSIIDKYNEHMKKGGDL